MMQRHLVAMFMLCAPLCACEEAPAPEAPVVVIEAPDAAPDVVGPCAAGCAPRLVNLPAEVSAPRGGTGTFQVVAEDQDDPGSLSFTVSERCALTSRVDEAGLITVGCPPVAETCVMWVGVKDGGELRDDQQLTMRCDEERAPEFLTTPPPTAREGEETSYAVRCEDANGGRPLLLPSGEDTCGGRVLDGRYVWTPGEGETSCTLGVSCTDGLFWVTQAGEVQIEEVANEMVNGAPRITNLPATIAADGGARGSFDVMTSDPDPSALLSLEITQTSCPFAVEIRDGVVEFQCGVGRVSCEAEVRVSDGEASAAELLRIECGNRPPAFVTTPPLSAQEGERYQYTPGCMDDDGDMLTMRAVTGTTCTGSGFGGVVSFFVNEQWGGRICTLRLECSDGLTEVYQEAVVQLIETNSAPVVSAPSASTKSRGLASALTVTTSDPDVPRQTLSLQLESDCSFPISLNGDKISYVCGDEIESCEAQLSASDGIEATTSTIQINCINDAPAVGIPYIIREQDGYKISPLKCTYTFGDANNDPNRSIVEWWRDGQLVGTGATLAAYRSGQEVECRVTPFDGMDYGAVRASIKYLLPIQAAATGGKHSCFIKGDKLYCWGENAHGQLGDGTTLSRRTPVAVSGMGSQVEAVAAGATHTCAIKAGALYCWGGNHEGQLGDGTTMARATPTLVQGAVEDLEQLALGEAHSCARRGVAVWCWGDNAYGQLGDGTTIDRATPGMVAGIHSAMLIAAGGRHTCAQQAGGYTCWGDNTHGQLGDGTTIARSTPVLSLATSQQEPRGALTAGDAHTCAVKGRQLYCWGDNSEGQVGDGSSVASRLNPTLLPTPAPEFAAQMSAGRRHTCANQGLLTYCWGANTHGQAGATGNGAQRTMTYVQGPKVTSPLFGLPQVSGGGAHSCLVRESVLGPELACWGDNTRGQLGRAAVGDQTSPMKVQDLSAGFMLSVGAYHSCVVGSQEGVMCWGDGLQLGVGGPLPQLMFVNPSGQGFEPISAGARHVCGSNGAEVACAGHNTSGQVASPPSATKRASPLQGDWPALGAGARHTCAASPREVRCWGDNASGQLGDGTLMSPQQPVKVVGLAVAQHQLAAGESHTCALALGALHCWGDNSRGQLGDGTTLRRTTPSVVTGLGSNVSRVFAGAEHTCAISLGRLYCWGANTSGQLGDGTVMDRSTPTLVQGLSANVTHGAAGADHTCAIRGGALYCWGDNSHGQLGDGTLLSRPLAAIVSGLNTGAYNVSAGDAHTCTVQNFTGALCWGSNSHGQLGYGVDQSWIALMVTLP
jgi:alpha-tubulin suppressor-like RCC1 family protein